MQSLLQAPYRKKKSRHKTSVKKIVGKKFDHWQIIRHILPINFLAWLSENIK